MSTMPRGVPSCGQGQSWTAMFSPSLAVKVERVESDAGWLIRSDHRHGGPTVNDPEGGFGDFPLVIDAWASITALQGMPAITSATAAVSRFAYGTCRNSFGPCALLRGPSTPQTIICACGNPRLSMFISGMVPPWP